MLCPKSLNEVKQEANRVKFRLVYRNELNRVKKEGRAKPSGNRRKDTLPQKPKQQFVANASNITIDISHFKDAEGPVPLLDASRFGQDQRGLAIMNSHDAAKFSRGQTSSVEPLAILVVGKTFDAQDKIFTMPAYDIDNNPIIINAALRQFGDSEICFEAALPAVKVTSAASTVLELQILRREVPNWKDCAAPLHYVGVHVSALRGDSLISTWSIKTFDDNRKPTPQREATMWHGFLRVPDSILELVLARSGTAGIYFQPKDETKRHDDRFGIVIVPNANLAELQQRINGLDKALGLTRVRDHLAVRCRREHITALRAVLLPDSAYVAADVCAADEQLWILKHVPSVDKNGLDQALQMAYWDAKTLRAQGQNRWIVAAKSAPPCHHLCINGAFVLIEALKRSAESPPVTLIAKQVKIDSVVSSGDGTMQVATSSRFQEVKAEMSEQFESRLAIANNKIDQLAAALQAVQANQTQATIQTQSELAQLREEQSFAKAKIEAVESSVVTSGQEVLTIMKSMMSQMQASLESSVKQLLPGLGDESKRPRQGDVSKSDQFSTST